MRRVCLLGLLGLVALAACRKEPRSATPPAPAPDAAVTTTRPAPDAGSCLSDCIRANQMKATSPENIEAECRAECARPLP